MTTRKMGRIVALAATALLAVPLAAAPAGATLAGDNVVINEVSPGDKFVELYNPTDQAIDLSGMYVTYYSTKGKPMCGDSGALSGSIAAKGYYLVHTAKSTVEGLPTPDALTNCSSQTGKNGGFALTRGAAPEFTGAVNPALSSIVDYVGVGTHANYEGKAASNKGLAQGKSLTRTNGKDTDNNSDDFSVADSTPMNSGAAPAPGTTPTPGTDPTTGTDPAPVPAEVLTIAQIQGNGSESPKVDATVTTEGFVTAVYASGGFNGAYIQSAGSGGKVKEAGEASDGLFVYGSDFAKGVKIGDYVRATGVIEEFYGLTEFKPSKFEVLTPPADAKAPVVIEMEKLPASEEAREAMEGMLVKITGPMTVTNNYQGGRNQIGLNTGEIGVAMSGEPLRQPSDVFNPTRDGAVKLEAMDKENAEKLLVLDDGMSTTFSKDAASKATPISWLTPTNEVRVGAAVTQTKPAVLDYRFNHWRLQAVSPLSGPEGYKEENSYVSFSSTRPASAPEVGGDISLTSFNVLNYFTTTAADINCKSVYTDRDGKPTTANKCGSVRGAADQENFERQQVKIVTAINKLNSDVVALEEIENTVKNGKDRDYSVSNLVDALNKAAGETKWGYVKSPSKVPSLESQDVIRLAYIYQVKNVKPVGESEILDNQEAFSNAREPLAQKWQAIDANGKDNGKSFVVVVNHFKSKGSGTPAPDKWQGNATADRVKQATALAAWTKAKWSDEPVFIVGDLNSYSAEDPILKLEESGYMRVANHLAKVTGKDKYLKEYTYQYGGFVGSLDQALGNEKALAMVNDAAVYSINAAEANLREYSRYNSNATQLWDASEFRSSDHDPVKIGITVMEKEEPSAPVAVTPMAPTFADGKVSIPSMEGVMYSVAGKDVTGVVEVAPGTSVRVEARAAEGFVLTEGATTAWSFAAESAAPDKAPLKDGKSVQNAPKKVMKSGAGKLAYTGTRVPALASFAMLLVLAGGVVTTRLRKEVE